MLQLTAPNKSVKLHIHRLGVVAGVLFVERVAVASGSTPPNGRETQRG